jgi:hypothetical protein
MDYGDLLKRGWNITWNHKYLWWLGFLAALGGSAGGGGGGGSNFNFPSGSGGSSSTGSGELPFDEAGLEQFLENTLAEGSFWAGIGIVVAGLVACLLLFSLVMWFVRLAAEAGLIHAAFDIDAGQKTSFGDAFAHGREHMGTLFVVNLILKAPIILFVLLFACAGFLMVGGMAGMGNLQAMESQLASVAGILIILPLCVFCLLVPYTFVVQLMYPIAQRGVVLGNLGAMDSVRHSWTVLKANVGEMLLLGIIFWFMMLIFGIASAIVVVPILVATLLPVGLAFYNTNEISTGLAILGGIGVVLSMIAGAFVSSVMVVMRSSTFTLAYLELLNRMKLGKAV